MDSGSFQIFNECGDDVPFTGEMLKRIVEMIQKHEHRNFSQVEVVFVGDSKILEMNREYLGHDYLTDIITFPYHIHNDDNSPVEGTLYCCAPQIRRQSDDYGTTYDSEVLRVVIHGLLHLIGYDDRSDSQRIHMQALENKYITLFQGS